MSMMMYRRRNRGNTEIVNDPTGGEEGNSTFIGGRWRPLKDANGDVTNAEWNGLPLNTWIQWGGDNAATGSTRLDQQLAHPYGAPVPYVPKGANPTAAHYDNFVGMGVDEVNARSFHFGGGHNGGSNNMLTAFNFRKGTHTLLCSPTPSQMYPAGYADPLGQATYPSGGQTYNFFPTYQTPAGDGKYCANHTYGGIMYIPGINEVITARHGWFHFKLDDGTWREGPQVAPADRLNFDGGRNGVGWRGFYIASTQRVYMTASPSFPHNTGANAVIVYNPATRDETTAFGFPVGTSTATYSNACIAPVSSSSGEKVVMWYFQGPFNDNAIHRCFAVNLVTGQTLVGQTDVLGRKPGNFAGTDDSNNPCQYVPELDTILMWCTAGSAAVGGAVAGEMLTFNRTTRTCALYPMSGTQPLVAARLNPNNKMYYWQEKKVLIFQTRTDINTHLIKLV